MYFNEFCGEKISPLGMGILRIPKVKDIRGNEVMNRRLGARIIDACMNVGINFFDTAYIYPDSENFVGDILSRYRRDSYMLASKYKDTIGKPIEEAFFEQLQRCRTSYFDIYMLHGLNRNNVSEYSKPEYMEFMRAQKAEGRIRHIGFSTHASADVLEQFLEKNDDWDMALMQLNLLDYYNLNEKRQYEILTEHNIPVFVMEPLKGSMLVEAGVERGFKWLKQFPNVKCVLSGMTTPSQVFENAGYFKDRDTLNEDELAEYENAISQIRERGMIPCTSCGYCDGVCEQGVNIRGEIKIINRDKMRGTAAEAHKTGCIGCGKCIRHCPQDIDIPSLLYNI